MPSESVWNNITWPPHTCTVAWVVKMLCLRSHGCTRRTNLSEAVLPSGHIILKLHHACSAWVDHPSRKHSCGDHKMGREWTTYAWPYHSYLSLDLVGLGWYWDDFPGGLHIQILDPAWPQPTTEAQLPSEKSCSYQEPWKSAASDFKHGVFWLKNLTISQVEAEGLKVYQLNGQKSLSWNSVLKKS